MNQARPREYIHSWYLLNITVLSLFFLLINHKIYFDLPLMVINFYLFFKNGLTASKFKRLLLYAFSFSFGIFILNIIFPSHGMKSGKVFHFFNFIIYQNSLDSGISLMLRLMLVSFLSMASGVVIDYTKVVLHLIVHKGLRLFWGYPFLLALNSIALFKSEYDRIRINSRLRNLPWRDQLSLFFPLLVFAIRHSQRGALALVTRGLSDEKTFYFSYDLSPSDKFLFKLFLVSFVFLIGITIYFR